MTKSLVQPLVSVIVPVFNAEKYLPETIKSVQNQTYDNWELILVNDKSKDESEKIAKPFLKDKRIHWINLPQNSGAAAARNKGINLANGRFIAFLDADDLWVKTKLEKQVNFMLDHNCAFSFTGYEFADASGKPNGKKVTVPVTITYKQALKNTTISTPAVMLNMDRLSKSDIKMPNVPSEDTATWWKILKKIHCAYGVPEILFYYRRHNGTSSSNKLTAIKRIWNLYRNVEKLNVIYSSYNFCFYAINAVRRRI